MQKNMLKISHTFQPESNIEWLSLIFSSERFARARERRQCWVSVSFKYSERSCRSWVFKDSTPNEAERGWVDMRQGRAADRRSIQQVSCMERHGAGYSGRRLKKVAERQLKPCQELPNTTSRGFLFHHFLVKTKTPKSAGHGSVLLPGSLDALAKASRTRASLEQAYFVHACAYWSEQHISTSREASTPETMIYVSAKPTGGLELWTPSHVSPGAPTSSVGQFSTYKLQDPFI